MGATELRYCTCGATRAAPANLRIVSCVRCGRALMNEPEVPAAPASAVAALAVLASQVVGAVAFAVALAWGWRVDGDGRIAVGVALAVGALWVLAGGGALRGSLVALLWCEVLDLALAALCLVQAAAARELVVPIVPQLASQSGTICTVIGASAGVAALACIAAIPQVRRMAAWQDAQIARLALRT